MEARETWKYVNELTYFKYDLKTSEAVGALFRYLDAMQCNEPNRQRDARLDYLSLKCRRADGVPSRLCGVVSLTLHLSRDRPFSKLSGPHLV